jgi:hypothetical protein
VALWGGAAGPFARILGVAAGALGALHCEPRSRGRKRCLGLIARQLLSIAGIVSLSMTTAHADDEGAFLPRLVVSSTIPASGDLNPYGVAFVPQSFPGSMRERGDHGVEPAG